MVIQTKNQLDPSEDNIWVSGTQRHFFEVNGVKFGITICHEGFRYPESATSLIDPQGNCIAYQDYGKCGVLIKDIDSKSATGLLAKRFKNELYEK